LDQQIYGPYPIIGMKGHSYHLKLPPHMRMLDPVQEILDSRLFHGRLQYKASWLAHDPDPAWYNARGFIGAPHKDPPARLDAWLKAYEAEEDLEVTEEDDKAALKTRVVQKSARRRL
ncbi:hypothetical protein K469DRAFT_715526, partial [Zopfia rhizophila CBS 207.26]